MKKKYDPKTYWESLLINDFNLSGVGFLGLGEAYNEWLYRARERIFKKVVNKRFPSVSSASILDIGCGTGFYVELWSKMGVEKLTGFDLTEVSSERLKTRYPRYEFNTTDITENVLPCKGEKFDIITAFDVLFHVVDDDKFENSIFNISRFAKKGTYILISDNFPRVEQDAIYCQKNRTLKYYSDLFKKENIEIVELRPVFYIMNAPVDLDGRSPLTKVIVKTNWKVIRKLVKTHVIFGHLIGCTLYYLEGALIPFIKNTVSTKLLVAKKK